MNATPVAKNIFARDFVSKFIGMWAMGYETVEKILQVMGTSAVVNQDYCTCNQPQEPVSQKTKSGVRILNPVTFEIVMEIIPPQMKSVKFC